MSSDRARLLSIMVPMRKRGSHQYNRGGNSRTAIEAVRDLPPTASQRDMETAVRREAVGAGSWKKCAEIMEAGFTEVKKRVDEQTSAVKEGKDGKGK